ncbi:hypothetical protein CWI39_3345p0010 [Hamiltosporidium magnivora]|uniref:Uncharacterized protein n=1 Tax=Hamiltosporidium magnivora TaxID=148818 RepID=A0A4Q9KQF6_9MICR|nr:hypothetical protein CWI39_3345p0010 [Hamiltosporidium magnivora]
MEFISNTVLEDICKESVQIEVIRVFRILGAKHLINSPEVDSNVLFKISKLFTRMMKIKDRQGNKNDKLRRLAVHIHKVKNKRTLKRIQSFKQLEICPSKRQILKQRGIIVLGRNTIVSEAIDNITDEGVSIKVNEQFFFLYRPLKSTEFNIVKPTLNQYLYKGLYIL